MMLFGHGLSTSLLINFIFTSRGSAITNDASSSSSSSSSCSIFLAPSTIPNAGLGIFTARPLKDEDVLESTNDIVINWMMFEDEEDIAEQEARRESGEISEASKQFFLEGEFAEEGGQFNYFTWGKNFYTDHVMMQRGNEGNHHVEFVPGFGAFPNSHAYHENCFINARENFISIDRYDRSRPHSGTDAYTPFHSILVTVSKDMSIGSEFFVDYGPVYFQTRSGFYQDIPLRENYDDANNIMMGFSDSVLQSSHPTGKLLPNDVIADLWSIVTDHAAHRRTKMALWKDSQKMLDHRRQNRELVSTLQQDDAEEGDDEKIFIPPMPTRSMEWLQENGVCIDDVRSGATNTILEAGRGAFARRSFRAGEVIAPSPVLQVNRTLQEGIGYHPLRQSSRLLMNYCLAHFNSTIMLCPYVTGVALMNHQPTKPSSKLGRTFGANAEIRLSNHSYFNRGLLELSAHTLLEELPLIGTIFDVVATRDIKEGEELFLDYGTAWEEAWEANENLWKKFVMPLNNNEPIQTLLSCQVIYDSEEQHSSTSLPPCIQTELVSTYLEEGITNERNRRDDNTAVSKKKNEHNVKYDTACFFYPQRSEDSVQGENDEDIDAATSSSYYASNSKETIYSWTYESSNGKGTTGGLFPCIILAQEKQQQFRKSAASSIENDTNEQLSHYTALIEAEDSTIIVKHVPHRAIRRVTDQWWDIPPERTNYRQHSGLPDPFRHPIMLPDNVFPSNWMDLNFQ